MTTTMNRATTRPSALRTVPGRSVRSASAPRGLSLVHADVEGPSVRGAAVPLATRSHARRQPAATPQLRLTRRGRFVVVAVLAVAALVVFTLGRSTAGAHAAGPQRSVTVEAGDTLWGIASRVAPERDPRDEVSDLAKVNHIDPDAGLTPGESLVVPAG